MFHILIFITFFNLSISISNSLSKLELVYQEKISPREYLLEDPPYFERLLLQMDQLQIQESIQKAANNTMKSCFQWVLEAKGNDICPWEINVHMFREKVSNYEHTHLEEMLPEYNHNLDIFEDKYPISEKYDNIWWSQFYSLVEEFKLSIEDDPDHWMPGFQWIIIPCEQISRIKSWIQN